MRRREFIALVGGVAATLRPTCVPRKEQGLLILVSSAAWINRLPQIS
jgi:hypothetical protein